MLKHFYSVVLLITVGAAAALAQTAKPAKAPTAPVVVTTPGIQTVPPISAVTAPGIQIVTPVPAITLPAPEATTLPALATRAITLPALAPQATTLPALAAPQAITLPAQAPPAITVTGASTPVLLQEAAAAPFQDAFTYTFNADSSYLGVFLEEVSSERAKELRLSEERGAIVMKVVEGSPAEKAGLKENDVIVGFNGRQVDSVRELQRLMSDTPAGRTVNIDVIRGGARQTVSATMTKHEWRQRGLQSDAYRKEALKGVEKSLKEFQKNKDQFKFATPPSFNFDYAPFLGAPRLGVTADNLTEQLGEYFGVKDGHGVLVSGVTENTPAAKAGLKAGDVIVGVDGENVQDVSALRQALQKKDDGALKVKVVRDRHEHTLTVNLEKRTPAKTRLTAPQKAKAITAPRRLI